MGGDLYPRHLEAMPLWRYTTGEKGINRVTVHERRVRGRVLSGLYIEWHDDEGRHIKALKSVTGHPVTDRDLAVEIAEDVAKGQRQKRNAMAASAWAGYSPGITLKQLLDRYHLDRTERWSESHRRDQERFRAFWEDHYAPATLPTLTEATVERLLAKEAKLANWSDRTRQAYGKYIQGAYRYAHRKLKWITEGQTLAGLDLPSSKGVSRPYTTPEVRKLLPALEEIDRRAGFVGWVCAIGGRRLNAVRLLETQQLHGDTVRFSAQSDKARRSGEVVLAGRALSLATELCDGRRWFTEQDGKPMRRERLIAMLQRAEEAAGIPHMKGRGYHGLKRWFATVAKDRKVAAKQSGTLETTLRDRYEQDEREPKRTLAHELERVLSGNPTATHPGTTNV